MYYLNRFKKLIVKHGLGWTLNYIVEYVIINNVMTLISKRKSRQTFKYDGTNYNYFIHEYNRTWRNERIVEMPVFIKLLERYRGKKVLEVGNVTIHYLKDISHLVIDKFETSTNHQVLKADAEHFESNEKFNLIFSISTFEHIGWDETPKTPIKLINAIKNLKALLDKDGVIVFSSPVGYNDYLDTLLRENNVFDSLVFLKRIDNENTWMQCDWESVKDVAYGTPWPGANGIVIGKIYQH